jgi:hypothetical protein
MEYEKAPQEIVALVSAVANEYHGRLGAHDVAVIMAEKATKRGGKTVLATASRPTPRLKPLLAEDVEFVITIAADTWATLDEAQREAVVDHELCHCHVDDVDGTPSIIGHDYEEFAAVVQRRGFWRRDFAEGAIQQAFAGTERPVKVTTLAAQG